MSSATSIDHNEPINLEILTSVRMTVGVGFLLGLRSLGEVDGVVEPSAFCVLPSHVSLLYYINQYGLRT